MSVQQAMNEGTMRLDWGGQEVKLPKLQLIKKEMPKDTDMPRYQDSPKTSQ